MAAGPVPVVLMRTTVSTGVLRTFASPMDPDGAAIVHPGLGLGGETAGGVSHTGGGEPGPGQTGLGSLYLGGLSRLHPRVVEGPAAGAFGEHQFEEWVGDPEADMARPAPGHRGGGQPFAEGHGSDDVGGVQCQLHSGQVAPFTCRHSGAPGPRWSLQPTGG